jgi:hypothetical protein
MSDPAGVAGELRDRVEMRRNHRRPQPTGVVARPLDEVLARCGEMIPGDWPELWDSPELAELEGELNHRLEEAGDAAPFPADWNASRALGRTSWVACRALGTTTVVETGVAAGLTSSFILAALEANGGGTLHSIDFQRPSQDPAAVGWLVPDRLRPLWRLNRGRSRRVLPPLVRELGMIDLFIHDGLHTEPTMLFDLTVGGGAVKHPGAVLCDDAESNPAFANWAGKARPDYWSLVETEFAGHHFGLAVFR